MVMDERESEVLRAFTTLNVSPRGRLELSGIQGEPSPFEKDFDIELACRTLVAIA